MKDILDIVSSVSERMDELERKREGAIAASRSVIRMTKRAIHAIHTGEGHESIINNAVTEYRSLLLVIQNEPEILFSGPVSDAMMELSEACILSSIVLGREVPSYTSLEVTPQAWAMGLGDCLGELRRILLAHLMGNRIEQAREVFNDMESLCGHVLSFDVPDAILPIRRKQDIARSVMERTRTDIANAMIMNNAGLKN